MKIFQVRGGVHPKAHKEQTKDKPFVTVLPKDEVIIPLSQHTGRPAKPVVKRNDQVFAGQLIAEADGFISANIISSCSGKVKAIEPRMTDAGTMAECIVIASDGEFKNAPGVGEETPLDTLTPSEIIEKIKRGGVVGMGGAGFPTHVKMMPPKPEEIKYIIANGAECEPYITCDHRLMLEKPEEIIGGLLCCLKIFPGAKGVVVIEDNKPDAIGVMKAAAEPYPNIEVEALKTCYPQGGERNIVYSVTGQYIASGALPASCGCVVDNVGTLAAIYRAVVWNEPLMERGFTVTGAVANPGNFMVRIGTPLSEVVEAAGGLNDDAQKLLFGGPMMGVALPGIDVPIKKANNALTVLSDDEVARAEAKQENCIRCGRCTRACPMGLIPQQMAVACERKDLDRFIQLHGVDCMLCGSCTYVCPAKRPLTPMFKQMKPVAMGYMRAKQAKGGK